MAAQTSFINSMLDTAFTGTITMKLFRTGLPSTTGVEVSGGGYAVQTLTMSAAANKVKASSANATFTNLPTSQTIVAWGVYKNGTLIDENTLSSPYTADITNNTLSLGYSFSLANT